MATKDFKASLTEPASYETAEHLAEALIDAGGGCSEASEAARHACYLANQLPAFSSRANRLEMLVEKAKSVATQADPAADSSVSS